MTPDNTVCEARTIVTVALPRAHGRGDVGADDLLHDLAAEQSHLARISSIVGCLAASVEDLRIRRTRGSLELSTSATDLSGVEAVLRGAGAAPDDYRIDVEYSRRWGML